MTAASSNERTQLLVIGAGPGGYAAAFRAADLGLSVTLVDRGETLGGVCLNVGCIPSKALLHAARVIEEAREMRAHGIVFDPPRIDLARLRGWKDEVVGKLTGGLATLARRRRITVLRGTATFTDAHEVEVTAEDGAQRLAFDHCIIATGSSPVRLPGLPDDPRILDSTSALELRETTGRLLVIGGGIIGLEMACVYEALGATVTVVELTGQLLPGCDADLVAPLARRIADRYEQVLLDTRVSSIVAAGDGLHVTLENSASSRTEVFDQVLVAVGRKPNGNLLAAQNAGIAVDERGFIPADSQMRSNVAHIFAIGDVAGAPMLAHKASHEGKVAAEVAAGLKRQFDARIVPSVAYTDPEVAWVGLTESDAKKQGIPFEKASFPWAASGRALSIARDEGFTKLLVDPGTRRVLGGAVVGVNAGELVAEIGLAIEMGADAADLSLTIHAHPTLSETIGLTAEVAEGTITDLYLRK
jgi:dihydrolipoamide dehydrogenase